MTDISVDLTKAREIIESYRDKNPFESLVPIFYDLQEAYGFVPEAACDLINERYKISLCHIYGVVTFYTDFHLHPIGRKKIVLCDGAACFLRGNTALQEAIKRKLGIGPGETTADGKYTLELVNCLGACDLAPMAQVEGHVYRNLTPEKIEAMLKGIS